MAVVEVDMAVEMEVMVEATGIVLVAMMIETVIGIGVMVTATDVAVPTDVRSGGGIRIVKPGYGESAQCVLGLFFDILAFNPCCGTVNCERLEMRTRILGFH
jgi:hypothetical protein